MEKTPASKKYDETDSVVLLKSHRDVYSARIVMDTPNRMGARLVETYEDCAGRLEYARKLIEVVRRNVKPDYQNYGAWYTRLPILSEGLRERISSI